MSTTIDNFTKQLHDSLETVEERINSLKKNIKSATHKNQTEIQANFEEAKTQLAAKKQQFDEYRAKLKSQLEEAASEVKSNIDDWKENREVQKLEHRAARAEDRATTAIFLAMATIQEAEAATLAALCTRLDAENAASAPAQKK